MKPPLLLIDVPNIACRNFYALPGLTHNDVPTAVVYGVLRDLVSLSERFCTTRFVFAFDDGPSLRVKQCPEYKSNRNTKPIAYGEEQRRGALRKQISEMRHMILPSLGYRNVFAYKGYEADDVIASVATTLCDEMVIISNDKDYYQLIDDNVTVWDGKRSVDLVSFHEKYGIGSVQWVLVKAIAGCVSDCVKGVPGVGELTALKYLRHELPIHHKAYAAIQEGAWKKNLDVVRLPYKGCPVPAIVDDEVDGAAWQKLCDEFGMGTLKRTWPGRRKFLFS